MKVWIRMAIFQVSSQQFMHVNCTYNMQVDGMTCFLFHGRVYLRSNDLYERIHIFSFLAGRPFPRLKFAFKIEIHIFSFLFSTFLLWNKKMSVRQVFCFCFFCSFLSSLLLTILCKVWKRLRRRRPTDWREAASVVKLVECSHDLSTVLWSIHWQGHLACYGRNYNNLSSFCSGLVVDLLWLTWKLCQK